MKYSLTCSPDGKSAKKLVLQPCGKDDEELLFKIRKAIMLPGMAIAIYDQETIEATGEAYHYVSNGLEQEEVQERSLMPKTPPPPPIESRGVRRGAIIEFLLIFILFFTSVVGVMWALVLIDSFL